MLWRLSQRQVRQADQNRHALVTRGPSLPDQDRQESGSQQAKSVDDQQKLSETFSSCCLRNLLRILLNCDSCSRLLARLSGAVESRASVQHFVLTFFGDQLLEAVHDFVASRHYGFYFIFG